MSKIERGLLIVISGPSGVGKGTVVKQLLTDESRVLSVSATTRKPREGELDGREYHFMSKEAFEKLISSDGLLEYAQYCDNYYGTPLKKAEELLSEGKDVILEIETKGAEKVRQRCSDAISIFISPPSMKHLRGRLVSRGTENSEVVEKRLAAAADEMLKAHEYDYIVINDTVENCAMNISGIINAEHHKSEKMKEKLKGVLEDV